MQVINTETTVPFNTIEIGHMFYFEGNVWTRISTEAARCVSDSMGCCNFMICDNQDNNPELVYAINMADVAMHILHNQGDTSNEKID